MCGRPPETCPVGYVDLGEAKGDPQFHLYRRDDDPLLVRTPPNSQQSNGVSKNLKAKKKIDWRAEAMTFAKKLTTELRAELASSLGLPEWVLDKVEHLGCNPGDKRGVCWTIPERDGSEAIIGINRRFRNGDKKRMKDSRSGLTIVSKSLERDGPIYLPEGASDTLALTAMGLAAVGRPNNIGGVDLLIELLKDVPAERKIVVLGESDMKTNMSCPGVEGAKKTAQALADGIGRDVFVVLPPDGAKDARAWLGSRNPDLHIIDELYELGEQFVHGVEKHYQVVTPKHSTKGGLATTCLAEIRPEPIQWLIPGYLPAGKLVLLAGDGGHGKSTITLHIAAHLSQGSPCLGLDYPTGEPCETLLLNCEDDFADTVVPRLMGMRADLKLIHRVDGVRDEKAATVGFDLRHAHRIEEELRYRPKVRLVVIDPVVAYVGQAGCDDHKDSQIRALLGPLIDLAAKTGVSLLLVKHFNKSLSQNAANKVGGSVGYINAVRMAHIVVPDPEDDERKLFVPTKVNIAQRQFGLAYRIVALTDEEQVEVLHRCPTIQTSEARESFASQLTRIQWEGQVDVDPDELIQGFSGGSRERVKDRDLAEEWLNKFLQDGPRPTNECVEAGNEALGLNKPSKWWRDEILKKRLGGQPRKAPGGTGAWYFTLVEHEWPIQEDQETQEDQES